MLTKFTSGLTGDPDSRDTRPVGRLAQPPRVITLPAASFIGWVAPRFALGIDLVIFGSGMAGRIGWLFTLAKKRAARLAGEVWEAEP